jgi:hypothetical protein
MNDLHKFDPAVLEWSPLTDAAAGAPPLARDSHGFAAAAGRLYVFGGLVYSGLVASVPAPPTPRGL